MKKGLFCGVATALITPMTDGKIDFECYDKLIDRQLSCGIDGLVICGTTGEAPTLSENEHVSLVEYAVRKVRGKIPIIAGTGCNNTDRAVYMSKKCYEAGASSLLCVTPYYNKCTQSGLIDYYTKIARSVPVPIIMYNVPSRTNVNIEPKTVKALAEIENICAIKEASGSVSQGLRIRCLSKETIIYSGNDDCTVPLLSIGGKGVISVLSNLMPAEVKKMTDLYFSGNTEKSAQLQADLMEITDALFCEPNPIPIKYAMSLMGICAKEVRSPLTDLSPKNKELIATKMKKIHLI